VCKACIHYCQTSVHSCCRRLQWTA